MEQEWNTVYCEKNVNSAFNKFLDIFNSLYDLNCPIHQISKRNTVIQKLQKCLKKEQFI